MAINPKFVFNHFEVLHGICTKTHLIKSLQYYYNTNQKAIAESYTCFDTTPTTYVVARASDDREIHMFLQRFRELGSGGSRYEKVPLKHCTKNMWVVKPAAQNQGRGIEVFRNAKDITNHIFKFKDSFWVI